jgi:hypothetical protein
VSISARAYGYLLAVPLFGISTGFALERRLDLEMRRALAGMYPDAPAQQIAEVTSARLCAADPVRAAEICSRLGKF